MVPKVIFLELLEQGFLHAMPFLSPSNNIKATKAKQKLISLVYSQCTKINRRKVNKKDTAAVTPNNTSDYLAIYQMLLGFGLGGYGKGQKIIYYSA